MVAETSFESGSMLANVRDVDTPPDSPPATVPAPAAPAAEHRTVGRIFAILNLVIASADGVRLGDLAQTIGAPKSSLHALAKGLLASGYLDEHEGRYVVGPAIPSLISARSVSLSSIYRHVLEQLSTRWGETSMLASCRGDSIYYLDSVQPASFIRATPPLNQALPMWPRSAGKCFMAHMDKRRLDAALRRASVTGPEADVVRAELQTVRDSGVALSVGLAVADHIAIAVPVVPAVGPVTLAISLAGPKFRMEGRVEEITQDLRQTVARLVV